jgi:hypothetical protein
MLQAFKPKCTGTGEAQGIDGRLGCWHFEARLALPKYAVKRYFIIAGKTK